MGNICKINFYCLFNLQLIFYDIKMNLIFFLFDLNQLPLNLFRYKTQLIAHILE
jgi:hypothetical protein